MATAALAVPTDTGKPGSDRAALVRFVERYPDRPLAWRRLGQHELRRGNRELAIEAFERAATEYGRRGLTLRAIDALKRLVAAVPDYTPAYVALADLIVALGLPVEAQRCFHRAAELYMAAGDPARAAVVLRRALFLWPGERALAQQLARVVAAAPRNNNAAG